MTGLQSEMMMNALYIRFLCAVLLFATALMATTAKAAGPAPARAHPEAAGSNSNAASCVTYGT
jgi:hypothetical protein